MSKCEHDDRFGGVFLLPPEDNGCVACSLERIAALVEEIQKAGWRACIDHIIKPESQCPVCYASELAARVQYLVDHWPLPLEDNGITFPDGDFWERKGQ